MGLNVSKTEVLDFFGSCYETKIDLDTGFKGLKSDMKDFAKTAGVKPGVLNDAFKKYIKYKEKKFDENNDVAELELIIDEYFLNEENGD